MPLRHGTVSGGGGEGMEGCEFTAVLVETEHRSCTDNCGAGGRAIEAAVAALELQHRFDFKLRERGDLAAERQFEYGARDIG